MTFILHGFSSTVDQANSSELIKPAALQAKPILTISNFAMPTRGASSRACSTFVTLCMDWEIEDV
jgi:hypothetical protein